jgi:DNA polymerase elongation subunit (family B)
MEFQVVTWESGDNDDQEFVIQMFGRNKNKESVYCETVFTPYFFIEVPSHFQDYHVQNYLEDKKIRDVISVRIVHRKKFFGFTNNKVFRFASLVFKNKTAWKRAYFTIRKDPKFTHKIYEANVDPILRFIHLSGIQSTGWVRVDKYSVLHESKTTCDIEIAANHWKHVSAVDDDSIAPMVVASYDIETYSPDRSFPDPDSRENDCPVIQIATTFQTYGSTEFTKTLLTLKQCDPIEGTDTVECFETERELLLRWSELISEKDPDIITGYNIWKFDNQYVYRRAVRTHCDHQFNLNRIRDMTTTSYKAKFSSSAYGDNEYDMITTLGRMQIDLLELYKRDHKLVKYSLNFVSEHFLGDHKVDMPIHEMFERYERGTPTDMQAIGEYCVKDTVLPLRLMQKLSNIPNLVEMARATYVPMNYLLERGQQIKVFSQICKQTQIEEMLVPTIQDGKSNESFVGATVLEAKKGAYMDRVITGLDFASLYPTIMRAHNLCYNTIVLDPQYKNLPGVEYETITWDTSDRHNEYTFAQTTQGILPKLLEQLAKSRKQAKKDMANAKDPFMKEVYNGKQLAFKVSMNSIYGFCSAFMLPCQPISACVTTIGRNMIEHTKNLVEEWYPGSEVVYGDSVTGDTPLLIQESENISYKRIDDLFDRYTNRTGLGAAKEYVVPDCLCVWSDQGFTGVCYVMRHKTTKRMYRIHTSDGSLVDVTEDHSLLLPNGEPVRPKSIAVGTELMTHKVPSVALKPSIETLGWKIDKAIEHHNTQRWTDLDTNVAVVIRIEDLGITEDYVYDLETENHHFHVGPGNLIVHNTDSVMVHFNTKELEQKYGKTPLEISFMLGNEAADRITKTFKQPIELEMEKCYSPYLLFSKKRYAGLMYTKPEAPDYIDAKGIQLVRRDNAPFVKDISKTVLHNIMYHRDVLGSVDLVQDKAKDLLEGKIPVDQLVVSKSMRKDYANDKQPHLAVAAKIEQRNPGSGPKCGERVPYLIMYTGNTKHLLYERAEDPTYVIQNGLEDKVDRLYYLEHGLVSPLESFFDLFIEGSKNAIFGDIIKDYQNKRKGMQNGSVITSFFTQNKPKPLPVPEHKKVQMKESKPKKKASQQRSITLFVK